MTDRCRPPMKPLETLYQGYRFRSRLEARWAVYFDAIGLQWEYEPQGFVVEGTPYLPDFWLPQVQMWAEVKPLKFTEQERRLCVDLALRTRFPCLLLDGVPACQSYEFVECIASADAEPHDDDYFFNDCMLSMYHNYPRIEHRFYSSLGVSGRITPELFWSSWWHESFDDVPLAVAAARGARFEHGEGRPGVGRSK